MRASAPVSVFWRLWLMCSAGIMLSSLCSCGTNMSQSLDGKRCSAEKTCLPGYVCDKDLYCVRAGSLTNTAGRSGAGAAGTSGAGAGAAGAPATAGTRAGAGGSGVGTAGTTAGTAGCAAGQASCSSRCVDVNTDITHCGGCDQACPAAEGGTARCTNGHCEQLCPAGFAACANKCVDIRTAEHCGGCNACVAGELCTAGQCQPDCAPPRGKCNGVCVDLQTDSTHCGACETSCAASSGAGAVCQAGQCVSTCDSGLTACMGGCVDLQTNSAHCGGCGEGCPVRFNGIARCDAAQCQQTCQEGYSDCPSGCVANLLTLQASLLGLNTSSACDAFGLLTAVNVSVACPDGQVWCDNECRDVMNDANHCGVCGATCPAGTFCSAARCVAP